MVAVSRQPRYPRWLPSHHSPSPAVTLAGCVALRCWCCGAGRGAVVQDVALVPSHCPPSLAVSNKAVAPWWSFWAAPLAPWDCPTSLSDGSKQNFFL